MKTPRLWSEGRAALLYEDRARSLVLALKHGDRPEIARPAGRWMAHAARPILQPGNLIVPVPLHWSRFLKRRYNQSALLAQSMADELKAEFCPDLLFRQKRTDMLDGKGMEDRYSTLRGAIRVHPNRFDQIRGNSILLVDDVMTTGATLTVCTEACLAANARDVRILSLARVAKEP